MWETIINMMYFTALVYMCAYVETYPCASKRKQYLLAAGVGLVIIVNIWICLQFPGVPIARAALFTQSLPSMLLCWIASRHKDARFVFVFCALDVIGFVLLLFINGIRVMFRLRDAASVVLYLLFLVAYICVFRRYGKDLRRITDKVQKKWRKLAVFVLLIYANTYLLILYPEPWIKRPEYAPVIMGYAVLILCCFYIIIWMLIDMDTIQDMEQKEYEMSLKIEKQSRELEEKKSRIMLHKIQPHFVYNVLMSIRYFTKKDSEVAYDMIYDFSNYLRANAEQLENADCILWSEELKHINAYVRIEKMRFKERLNIVYEIGEEDFSIPPLTVEPLVENAVKHGITQKIAGGTVWIRSRTTETQHEIEIEDDGVGFDAENIGHEKSVGLDYIRARLAMLGGASMKIESEPGKGTKALLTFAKKKTCGGGEKPDEGGSGR